MKCPTTAATAAPCSPSLAACRDGHDDHRGRARFGPAAPARLPAVVDRGERQQPGQLRHQRRLPLVAVTVLDASAFAVSALAAATWLPWLLIGLPAGAWVDRLSRRRVMLVADWASAAAFLSVPIAAALGRLTIGQLVVVALVAGTAKVFFATAYRAYLPFLVSGPDLLEANAKLQGSEQVANLAGPGLAGLLAQLALGGRRPDRRRRQLRRLGHLPDPHPTPRAHPRQNPPAPARRHPRRLAAGRPGSAYCAATRLYGCAANLCLTGYQSLIVILPDRRDRDERGRDRRADRGHQPGRPRRRHGRAADGGTLRQRPGRAAGQGRAGARSACSSRWRIAASAWRCSSWAVS